MPPATIPSRTAQADFQRQRKQDSRQLLLAAALQAFCTNSYFAVSIDEIASAAGVSRMTFYRHFGDKAAIAFELFRESALVAIPRFQAIGLRDFRDRQVVRDWIAEQFAANRASGPLLRVFMQANADVPEFAALGHGFIDDLIGCLGEHIPPFAIDRDDPAQRRRWIEAWLLIYEILDQGNHAARGSGVATDPVAVDILADRFIAFVERV